MKLTAHSISTTQRKLQELILYISMKSETDERFGKVKLNKLLFYSDFLAYLYFGSPITGQDYQKLDMGPCPKAMLPVMNAMQDLGDIAIRESDYFGRTQQRVFALRAPNLSLFSGDEIALVDELISRNWHKNGKEISDDSHNFHGWKLTSIGDTIPYSMALVGDREPSQKEREIGKTLEPIARNWLAAA